MSDRTSTAPRDYRWFLPGEPLSVGGRTITCGFLYAGAGGAEPSLVDSRLPASEAGQYPRERCFTDSYASFPSGCRGTYLDWLARGRTGRVFPQALTLFLMGVERRWLEDGADPQELLDLSTECRRLAGLYANVETFAHRAADLADAIRLWTQGMAPSQVPVDFAEVSQLRMTIGLREIAADRRPLPWEWALLLGAGHPHGRTIRGQFNHEEFRELFAIRYADQFGPGIVLPAGEAGTYTLYVQNPTLQSRGYGLPFRPQAGVEHAGQEAAGVVELAKCVDGELRTYLFHKRPAAPINVGLLPEELIERFGCQETGQLVARIETGLANSAFTLLTWQEVLEYWRSPELYYGIPQRLSRILGARGLGFEPHPVHPIRSASSVRSGLVFFRDAGPSEITKALQATVAVVDAVVPLMRESDLAPWPFVEHLARSASLTQCETIRLQARAAWHMRHRSNQTYERFLLFRDLPLAQWLRDAWLTIFFDGSSLAESVSESAYTQHRPILSRYGIDLPPRSFAKPARRAPQKPISKNTPTPGAVANQPPSFQLDEAAVQAMLDESKRATAFVNSLSEPDSDVASLSPRRSLSHSELDALRELLEARPVSRRDLDALCRKRSLFTLAFVEHVNDFALEVSGEPAIHLGGEIDLDLSTLTTIIQTEPIPCNP